MSNEVQIAREFGEAIIRGDFEAAHALFTEEAQRFFPASALRAAVADMIAYAEEPLTCAEVMEEFVLHDWPGKQAGDLARVYVALDGESFSEAAYLHIVQTAEGATRIRQVEWGRP